MTSMAQCIAMCAMDEVFSGSIPGSIKMEINFSKLVSVCAFWVVSLTEFVVTVLIVYGSP